MSKILYFADSPRTGRGATIRLDSGEPCLLSIAQSGVRVKKSRLGLFGPVLYNEKIVYRNALTAKALSLLFPASKLPPGFNDPVLRAFTNAILHCSTCAEVTITLNEAIARAEKQAISDTKIVSGFGAFMTKGRRADCFYDASMLPHPKEAILAAIERLIVSEQLESRVEALRTGAVLLWNFQEGVGPDPLPLTGADLSQLQRTSPNDPKERAKNTIQHPNFERAKRFLAVAKTEMDQTESRIEAASRLRNARFADVDGDANRRLGSLEDARAQQQLGDMYVKRQDYVEAAKCYAKAADLGNVKAQSQLGHMYAIGVGVAQDYAEAVTWCRIAAEQGEARAQGQLGDMYIKRQTRSTCS